MSSLELSSVLGTNWDGRLPTLNPKLSSSSKLGSRKAEEFSKFIAVAPVVLTEDWSLFALASQFHLKQKR